MAEAFTRQTTRRRGLDVGVSSCGVLEAGRQVPDEVGTLMDARGLDLWNHESSILTGERVRSATLVLGMERRHVREAASLVPAAFPRIFTLPELVRRLDALEPPEGGEVPPLDDRLAVIAAGRTRRDLLGHSAADEIDDPINRQMYVFERVADEIEANVERLVDLIWPESVGAAADVSLDATADVGDAGPDVRETPPVAEPTAPINARSMRAAARARSRSMLRGPSDRGTFTGRKR